VAVTYGERKLIIIQYQVVVVNEWVINLTINGWMPTTRKGLCRLVGGAEDSLMKRAT
jgi:hypothetical protein